MIGAFDDVAASGGNVVRNTISNRDPGDTSHRTSASSTANRANSSRCAEGRNLRRTDFVDLSPSSQIGGEATGATRKWCDRATPDRLDPDLRQQRTLQRRASRRRRPPEVPVGRLGGRNFRVGWGRGVARHEGAVGRADLELEVRWLSPATREWQRATTAPEGWAGNELPLTPPATDRGWRQ